MSLFLGHFSSRRCYTKIILKRGLLTFLITWITGAAFADDQNINLLLRNMEQEENYSETVRFNVFMEREAEHTPHFLEKKSYSCFLRNSVTIRKYLQAFFFLRIIVSQVRTVTFYWTAVFPFQTFFLLWERIFFLFLILFLAEKWNKFIESVPKTESGSIYICNKNQMHTQVAHPQNILLILDKKWILPHTTYRDMAFTVSLAPSEI